MRPTVAIKKINNEVYKDLPTRKKPCPERHITGKPSRLFHWMITIARISDTRLKTDTTRQNVGLYLFIIAPIGIPVANHFVELKKYL